jgi:hypothetical protein
MKPIILLLLINLSSYSNDISEIRKLYLEAHISQSDCKNFGEKITNSQSDESALIKGYKGCFYFIKCEFVNSPVHKFLYFNKAKKLLESAIKDNQKSVELKFLRFSIQKNIPNFLQYNNSLEEDLKFINENIQFIKDKETRKFISNALKSITK